MHLAAWFSSASIVKVILEAGLDINVHDHDGLTPLHYAAKNQDVDVVKMIINTSGADVRAVDKGKQTPLHIAARFSNIDIVQLLIDNGVSKV